MITYFNLSFGNKKISKVIFYVQIYSLSHGIYIIKMFFKLCNFLRNENFYFFEKLYVQNFLQFNRIPKGIGTLPTNVIDLEFRQIRYT